MAPWPTGIVTGERKFDLNVGEVDCNVEARLKEICATAKDTGKHVVVLDVADDVLDAEAPVVEDGVADFRQQWPYLAWKRRRAATESTFWLLTLMLEPSNIVVNL